MRIILVLSLLLTSCATKETHVLSAINDLRLENKLITEELKKLDYYIKHDKCFITYAICLGEKKPKCWAQHEDCVVDVYKEWMRFK